MRLHVLLLLLLALPLRGWVGDAMAMEMAQAALQANATTPMADAAMPADCPMHMAGPAAGHAGAHMAGTMPDPTAAYPHTDPSQSPPHGHAHVTAASDAAHTGGPHAGHAGACTLCDICHGASLASAPAALGAVVAPHAAPAATSTRFASVLRAPDLRPPIL